MRELKLLLLFYVAISTNSFGQCELNFHEFIPPMVTKPNVKVGSKLCFNNILPENRVGENKVLICNFIRLATKKELKNLDKISPELFYYDSTFYKTSEILQPCVFKNETGIASENFIIHRYSSAGTGGKVNHIVLNPEFKNTYPLRDLISHEYTVEHITSEFIVLNSDNGQFVYFRNFLRSDYDLQKHIESSFYYPIDSLELSHRKVVSNEYVGMHVHIKYHYSSRVINGSVNSASVEPYATSFKLKSENDLVIDITITSKDTALFKWYDSNCLQEHNLNLELEEPNYNSGSVKNENKSGNSTSVQCTGRTQKGARCKRMTTSPSGRCYQH